MGKRNAFEIWYGEIDLSLVFGEGTGSVINIEL